MRTCIGILTSHQSKGDLMKNIQEQEETSNGATYSSKEYDHYIAVDCP